MADTAILNFDRGRWVAGRGWWLKGCGCWPHAGVDSSMQSTSPPSCGARGYRPILLLAAAGVRENRNVLFLCGGV